MNIEDLTIKQAKELSELFSGSPFLKEKNIYDRYKGKYVICRSRNEGVNFGIVLDIDETGVVLQEDRRLYYHRPKNKNVSWYEGVALTGISNDSKIGPPAEKIIVEDYSLTVCALEAAESLREAKTNEQS